MNLDFVQKYIYNHEAVRAMALSSAFFHRCQRWLKPDSSVSGELAHEQL